MGEDHADFSVPNSCISAYDERHKALGKLVLFSKTDGLPEQAEAKYWQALRISLGVPEGAADLTPNRALMLEAGLHLLGAIDFEKGVMLARSDRPHPLSWSGQTPPLSNFCFWQA